MIDDTDLSALDPREAREYVLAFITTLKQTSRRKAEIDQELGLWRSRVTLAHERGTPELAAKAQGRVEELHARLAGLEAEEQELARKVVRLKEELKKVEALPGGRTVDTDYLLAQLELLVGERDETSEALRETEADAALQELKRKMEKGG